MYLKTAWSQYTITMYFTNQYLNMNYTSEKAIYVCSIAKTDFDKQF